MDGLILGTILGVLITIAAMKHIEWSELDTDLKISEVTITFDTFIKLFEAAPEQWSLESRWVYWEQPGEIRPDVWVNFASTKDVKKYKRWKKGRENIRAKARNERNREALEAWTSIVLGQQGTERERE